MYYIRDRFSRVMLLLGMISTTVCMAVLVAYSCSPIVVILTIISAALWTGVAILHVKRRAAIGNIPLLSDLNIIIAAAVVIIFSTLVIAVIALLSTLQGRCG